MRKGRTRGLLALAVVAIAALASAGPSVRQPAVAGQFYAGDAEALLAGLEAMLADARPARIPRPVAIVAPHAGYVFSGQIAADAWRQAAGHDYEVIVILGTNHRAAGLEGVSVDPASAYRTPLGEAAMDVEVAAALREADPRFVHDPQAHEGEHSVEVQVPFAQHLFPGAKIAAAVVGRPDPDLCRRFGEALAAKLKGRRALIVASSDLSHYPRRDDAAAVDGKTLEAIASLDPERLRRTIRSAMDRGVPGLGTCACGEASVLAAMAAAQAMGATRGEVISYANSGDTALGEPERVVGYGAVAFFAGEIETPPSAPAAPPSGGSALGPSDRETLTRLARETVRRYLTTGTTPLARDLPPALGDRRGAFVTLKKHGELRGCIGHIPGDQPLARVVGAMALRAALKDPRFPAVRADELDEIAVEISVLTPLRPIDPADVEPGVHGLLLRKGRSQGVLLPQVATEQGWNREELLEGLCRKAGLAKGCWRDGAELLAFRAEVFGEEHGESPVPPGS